MTWVDATPEQIMADLEAVAAASEAARAPDVMALPVEAYADMVRRCYPGRANTYRRLFLLFNAGCRGDDLT